MRSLLAVRRRFRIGFAVAATLLLLYALTGFLLVPKLASSAIRQQLAVDGHQLAIGRFTFNPFSLEVRIEGFALNDSKGAPLLAFKALQIDVAALASLWQRGLVLQELVLQGPYVSLVREADGSINLIKLLPPSKEPAKPAAGPPPRIRIGTLAVDDGKLDLKDLSRPKPFATSLSPIHFGLKDFRTELAHGNAYQFSAGAASGEQLDWSGEFSVQPLASTGRFALRNLQAKTVEAYLQNQLPVRLLSGVAAVEGSYELKLDPVLALNITLPAISLRQFALEAPDSAATEPPLAIAELRIAGVTVALAGRSVSVQSVEIAGARINAQREADGSLSLSRLLPQTDRAAPESPGPTPARSGKSLMRTPKPPAPAATAPPPAPAASGPDPPWQIGVDRIRLIEAALVFDDRGVTPATHFALNPVNLGVDGYSSAADAKLKITGDLRLNQSATLNLGGELRLQPLNTTLNLNLQGLDLPPLQPYLAAYTGLRLKSGQLGGKLQMAYAATPDAGANFSFGGDLGVANFVAQDAAQQDFLKWRQLAIAGIDYQQTPQKLSIQRIALQAPYARLIIEPDRTLNIAQALGPPGPAAANPAQSSPTKSGATAPAEKPPAPAVAAASPKAIASKPMPIRIDTISLDSGSLNFADRSIEPQFATAIVGLSGRIAGLSTAPASRAKLHFEGSVDKYAPAVISGEINPLAASKYADVSLSFRNMDLTTFNPYSGRFAGYNIVKGKLTTELRYNIDDRKLRASHHVVVDRLEFGEATGSKQAVPLPVRLAVSLLKDRNGVIDLDLPVAGSLDDPSFSLGPILWKVLLNLLTKVVTAPFAAIGALFGGGDELSWVDFSAGSAALNDDARTKLDKLAAALVERPQLRLDVPLALAETQDRAALAKTTLQQLLAAGLKPDATARDRQKALERIYRDQFRKSPDYPDAGGGREELAQARGSFLEAALLSRLAPDAATLQQLAKDRAQAVQDALLASPGISAERIFVTAGDDAASTADGAVRMSLKLE